MSSTVTVGSMEVTSNESSADMLTALAPTKEEGAEPRVLVDKGEPVEQEEEKDEASKAAALIGKKGGEATAAKKAAEAKEAEKDKTVEAATDDEDNPRHSPKARVAEKAREAAEAREEARRERAERQRVEAENAQLKAARLNPDAKPAETAKPAAAEEEDPEPKEEDFPTYSDFVKALGRHSARQENKELQKRAAEQYHATEQRRAVDQTFKTFFGRMDEATKTDPTVPDRTIDFVGKLQPSVMVAPEQRSAFNAASDEILASDNAPALIDHFIEHPAEFQRIATLRSRREVAREMAKVEARLETAKDAATAGASVDAGWKPGSTPLRPVKGAPYTADRELDEDAPLSAFVARDNQRRLAERGR